MIERTRTQDEQTLPKEITVISNAIGRINIWLKEENHDPMFWRVKCQLRERSREVQYMDIMDKLDNGPFPTLRKLRRLHQEACFLLNKIDPYRILRHRTGQNFPPLPKQ